MCKVFCFLFFIINARSISHKTLRMCTRSISFKRLFFCLSISLACLCFWEYLIIILFKKKRHKKKWATCFTKFSNKYFWRREEALMTKRFSLRKTWVGGKHDVQQIMTEKIEINGTLNDFCACIHCSGICILKNEQQIIYNWILIMTQEEHDERIVFS